MSENGLICAEQLVKAFGHVRAVDGISLEVARGEVFAFLGPNGAGKTTTVQMLTTLARPTSGRIIIDGIDALRQPSEVRRRLGIVFQEPSLDLELTAWENMQLHACLYGVARAARRPRIEQMLRLFQLWDRRRDLVKTLSAGTRRRLEVARALLHSPKILFLDEPTLGLDPKSRKDFWQEIRQLNQAESATVFVTTHYLEECERFADRVAIINHGRIIAQGAPAQLRLRAGANSLEQAFLAITQATPEEPSKVKLAGAR